ncbi:MAG TPA: enoyl-CoA hydratase [Desulfotomaculum sp.]|nr:enoyl-CoA hydratase [Desulfotomaculum sp.]
MRGEIILAFESLKVGSESGVITITLARPPLNVLTIPMMEEMVEAFKWAKDEPGGVVILDAEGKAFSAGVDVADHTPDKVDSMIDVFDRLFLAMDAVEKPIICLVNGAALGGGCEVVLFCDMVLASEKAKLGQPEIQVGVFPPVACFLLPKLCSWPRAMDLLLSGDTIGAEQAEKFGIVNKVLPADNFKESAMEYLKKFTALSPVVLAMTKKAARAGLGKGFAEGIKDIDRIYLKELMVTADAQEGLKAFMEKRRPVWQGK